MKPSTRSKTAAAQRAEYQAWYDEQVRLGIEDIKAGRVYSHEEVQARIKQLTEKLRAEDQQQHAA